VPQLRWSFCPPKTPPSTPQSDCILDFPFPFPQRLFSLSTNFHVQILEGSFPISFMSEMEPYLKIACSINTIRSLKAYCPQLVYLRFSISFFLPCQSPIFPPIPVSFSRELKNFPNKNSFLRLVESPARQCPNFHSPMRFGLKVNVVKVYKFPVPFCALKYR